MKAIFSLALSLSIWTCFGAPARATPQEAVAAERPALPDTWRSEVDAYFSRALKDPYSAVKEKLGPVLWTELKTTSSWGLAVGTWAVCYKVNAKNSYGAYTGEQAYLFTFSSDGLTREVLPSNTKISRTAAEYESELARKTCAGRSVSTPQPRSSQPQSETGTGKIAL